MIFTKLALLFLILPKLQLLSFTRWRFALEQPPNVMRPAGMPDEQICRAPDDDHDIAARPELSHDRLGGRVATMDLWALVAHF